MTMPKLILDIWHGERGIDLGKWKAKHSLWGVIAKCGGSDDPKWGRYEETTWVEQVTQARSLGLHVGAYYYSNATTTEDALADAKHCVEKCMRGMQIDLPIYLDIEERSQLDLPMYQLTNVVTTFCNYVRKAGYKVGIYSGYEGFHNMHESDIASYSLWVASWRTSWPIWAKDYDLWQEGSIDFDGNKYHENWNVDQAGHIDLDWASDEFAARIEQGSGKMPGNLFNPAEEWAEVHAFMCTDPRFGYNQQPNRWGGDYNNGEIVEFTSKSGRTYKLKAGSYDCSSSTITSCKVVLARTKYAGVLDDATYTGDMRSVFVRSGLFEAKYSPAHRGDLYLAEGKHVAMCQDGGSDGVLGYDCLSEFVRNENHAASYGKPGDQDGYESVIRGYYDDQWNTVLHYVGGLLEDIVAPPAEEQDSEETSKMMMCFVKFDGDGTENFFDGQNFHALRNTDEKKAIIDFYQKAFGITISPNPINFGSKEAPYGARLVDAMLRGPQFATLEAFERHPSVAKVVSDQIRATTAKTDNKSIAEAVKKVI